MDDTEQNHREVEFSKQSRMLIIGVLFTAPLVVYSMMSDFGLNGFPGDKIVKLIMASVVQFIVGWQFYIGAFKSLRFGSANMDYLF